MSQWMRFVLLLWSVTWVMMAAAAQPHGTFSSDLAADQYDCRLVLKPAMSLAARSKVWLRLEYGEDLSYVSVLLSSQTLTINSVTSGKAVPVVTVPVTVTPGMPYALTLLRRGQHLSVLHGEISLYSGDVPRSAGSEATVTVEPGWTIAEATVQPLEPVVFADDFMRGPKEKGPWAVVSGKWLLQSAWDQVPQGNGRRFENAECAQNPFAWVGVGTPKQPALCMVGTPFWEDYTLTLAVQPTGQGAVGAQVNMPDARNGIRVRWSAGSDRGPGGNELAIYRVVHDQATKLTSTTGGYIPGQWYKLSVTSSADGVAVAIDGQERLTTHAVTPWRGGIGLYTEGQNEAIFDDVTVYGRALKADMLLETRQARIKQRFHDDPNGMQKWSTYRADWQAFPEYPGFRLYQWPFSGDQWLTADVKPMKLPTGELTLILNSDGKTLTSGYRLVAQLSGESGKADYTLYRNEVKLATAQQCDLLTDAEYQCRFSHIGNRLSFEINGETVLEASDNDPLPGGRPAYAADAYYALTHDVMVLGRQIYDYSFAEAPVDWIPEGTWAPSIRWSCSPNWSFLAGWSRGDAALWHKQTFTGDQSLQAFLGLKMEYPRQRAIELDRLRDIGIAICSDGSDPRSGYAGVFAASQQGEKSVRRIVLLRKGVEVASAPAPSYDDYYEFAHQHWFQLELRKQGDTVEFWVEGETKPKLTFKDPAPLMGGVPAIWTTDNGLNVARVRLHAVNPPQPRTTPRVILDAPWSPEWASVGVPVTLNFRSAWSTADSAVHLEVIPREVPEGEGECWKIEGQRITITPQKAGEHWYQVRAVDEQHNVSFPYDLNLQVFKSSLGRDDRHAILLYRFTEGQGSIVHDQSKMTPPADITIPKSASVQWLPGQGLALNGKTPLMTPRAVTKLMAMARKNAFTIELWVSTKTIAPPTQTNGCMLSWESSSKKQNLAVGQCWYDFYLTANGREYYPEIREGEGVTASDAARPWLQHYMITFNGKTVRIYVNGKQVNEESVANYLVPTKWSADAPLLLGNHCYGTASYIGTYYLVAMYDQCLTPATVLRHYSAGPAAR